MRAYLMKIEGRYLKEISTDGTVVTSPHLFDAQLYGPNELTSLLYNEKLQGGQIMEAEITLPMSYEAQRWVATGMAAMKEAGIDCQEMDVSGWFDLHGWPHNMHQFIRLKPAMINNIATHTV